MTQSVLNDCRQAGICGIFLSTLSSLSTLVHPRDQLPSDREIKSGSARQPPFVELPFDRYRGSAIIKEDRLAMTDVCNVEFLCRFGRPL